jgi:hypothetical protein
MSENFVRIEQRPDYKKNLATLTKKELRYWQAAIARKGVPFLTSRPGIGKSAIWKTIAMKMKCAYYDIRLSMADETDMQFPNLVPSKKYDIHVIEHAVPEWGVGSNDYPAIVHFEELNRSPRQVRNAALQVLLDRAIGPKFKFNDNVFLVSSGNLGDEDNTDVDEMDAALNNRLIHIKHTLSLQEWMEWAIGNIHPDIITFHKVKEGEYFLSSIKESENAYATPRSWEMLSEALVNNFGGGPKVDKNGEFLRGCLYEKDDYGDFVYDKNMQLIPIPGSEGKGDILKFPDGYKLDEEGNVVYEETTTKRNTKEFFVESIVTKKDGSKQKVYKYPVREWGSSDDYKSYVYMNGAGTVGAAASKAFRTWLDSRIQLNLKDVIEDYRKVEPLFANFGRDKVTEILQQAYDVDITKWDRRQIDNYGKFLKNKCKPEERTAYFLHMLDESPYTSDNVDHDNVIYLVAPFKDELLKTRDYNDE